MLPRTGPTDPDSLRDERLHSPADCALVFAVPTTRDEFQRCAGDPRHDFVPRLIEANPGQSQGAVWAGYAPMAEYALDLTREASRAGALIAFDASFDRWRQTLNERPVVILFAHCRPGIPDAVEFADGLYDVDDLAQVVPRDFRGVLDFTVCYSLPLIRAIKNIAPRSQIIANKNETALDERLALLRQTLRLLAAGGFSYPGAAAKVHLLLLAEGKSR